MELKKKYIHMSGQKGRASSQVALDDDFNVPDSKPDISKVIVEKGEIVADETRVTADHVWIRGRLLFYVLYQPQEESGLRALKGEIPFQENISMDGISEKEKVRFRWKLEDLNVSLIHPRKLGIRALLEITVLAEVLEELPLTYEVVRGEQEEIEVKKEQCEIAQLLENRHDTCRFRQEISLPSNKPNIREILWKCIQPRGMEKVRREGEIEVSGELLVFILYEGEEQNLEWFETAVPVKTMLECQGKAEGGSFDVKLEEREMNLEVKNDYDGEPRAFQLDANLDAQICIYEIDSEEYVEDLYGVNCEIVPEQNLAIAKRIMVKNHAKIKATDKVKIQESKEIVQICCCEGSIEVDRTQIVEDGVEVMGTVDVRLLYLTGTGVDSLRMQRGFIPFQQKLEAPGIRENCIIEVNHGIEQLNTILGEENQVEVRAVLNLELVVIEPQQIRMVTSATLEENNMETLQKIPGMVGYIAREGECVWDIAKENHTTTQKIKQMNQLNTDILKGGEKILIIKSL